MTHIPLQRSHLPLPVMSGPVVEVSHHPLSFQTEHHRCLLSLVVLSPQLLGWKGKEEEEEEEKREEEEKKKKEVEKKEEEEKKEVEKKEEEEEEEKEEEKREKAVEM